METPMFGFLLSIFDLVSFPSVNILRPVVDVIATEYEAIYSDQELVSEECFFPPPTQ